MGGDGWPPVGGRRFAEDGLAAAREHVARVEPAASEPVTARNIWQRIGAGVELDAARADVDYWAGELRRFG